MSRLIAAVSEGICPTHHTPLDRSEGEPYGLCAECGLGYSTDGEGVTAHVVVTADMSEVYAALDRANQAIGRPARPTRETP